MLGQILSPSQIAPKDLRPVAPSATDSVMLPAAGGLDAPAGSDQLFISLSAIRIDGGFDELAASTEAILADLRGRRIAVSQIYATANAIERRYAAAGYVLVRLVVPPQQLDDGGSLQLKVIDGSIEAVDVRGVPQSLRKLVSARMAPLVGRRRLLLTEIERRLLLAGDIPGLAIRSTLALGQTQGGAKLVLEATHHSVAGSVGVDNHLPSSLGVYSTNAALSFNSILGLGEQVYLTGSSGVHLGQIFASTAPISVVGGGVSAPLGFDGVALNAEYTHSTSRPLQTPGSPASVGYLDRGDLRLTYPWLRTRTQTLALQGTLEWNSQFLVPVGFGSDLYRDRYYVVRFQADDQRQWSGGAGSEATLVISHGLTGRDGASAAASQIALSRQGAGPSFTKANVSLQWAQTLPAALQLSFGAFGQTSFGRPLLTTEALSLDGPAALSGFPSGTFTVDEGVTVRAELGRNSVVPVEGFRASVSPYVFAAAAHGLIDQATAAQRANEDAGSLGAGVRTALDSQGAAWRPQFGAEVARFLSDLPRYGRGWRLSATLQLHF